MNFDYSVIPTFLIQSLLHAFEPDVNYHHSCEFAKQPDRASSERMATDGFELIKRNNNESDASSDYQLFPNPNDGRFVLYCNHDDEFDMLIFDKIGREVYRMHGVPEDNKISFDLEGLAQGIYLLSIRNEKGVKTIRFSIQ